MEPTVGAVPLFLPLIGFGLVAIAQMALIAYGYKVGQHKDDRDEGENR